MIIWIQNSYSYTAHVRCTHGLTVSGSTHWKKWILSTIMQSSENADMTASNTCLIHLIGTLRLTPPPQNEAGAQWLPFWQWWWHHCCCGLLSGGHRRWLQRRDPYASQLLDERPNQALWRSLQVCMETWESQPICRCKLSFCIPPW